MFYVDLHILITEKNVSNQAAHHATEQKQHAPNGKEQRNNGLAGNRLINRGEYTVRRYIVIQAIGKNKYTES